MIDLCSIFDRHAPEDFAEAGADQMGAGTEAGDAATEAESHDHGLEFKDNPFTSFMRKLREMINRDPREALRMVDNVRQARIFTKTYEEQLIHQAKERISQALSHEKPEGSLAQQFLRSAFNIIPAPTSPSPMQTANQNLMHPTPVLRPAYPAPGANGLGALALNL